MLVAGVNTLTTPFALGLNDAGHEVAEGVDLAAPHILSVEWESEKAERQAQQKHFFHGSTSRSLILSEALGIGARERNYPRDQHCCQGALARNRRLTFSIRGRRDGSSICLLC